MKRVLLTGREHRRLLGFMALAQQNDDLLATSLTLAFCMVEFGVSSGGDAERIAAVIDRLQTLSDMVRDLTVEIGEESLAEQKDEKDA